MGQERADDYRALDAGERATRFTCPQCKRRHVALTENEQWLVCRTCGLMYQPPRTPVRSLRGCLIGNYDTTAARYGTWG